MIVKDKSGDWHEMKQSAHRLISLCGYLNLDVAHVERGEYQGKEGEPTCPACAEKKERDAAKAREKK